MHQIGLKHFQTLEQRLQDYAWLWRPQPYKQARPEWCQQQPQLTQALLQLSDAELAHYADDTHSLLQWLGQYVPGIAGLIELTQLPQCQSQPLQSVDPFLHRDIPGRKWQQIEAFSAAIDPADLPLLEWCGGKGHLGRLLAREFKLPVQTLERNAALCAEGQRLSRRAKVQQQFHVADVLMPVADNFLPGHHAIALHACGELHRSLLRRVVAARVEAVNFSPCCYHLGCDGIYQPFTTTAQLQLGRDDLRLAVTETVTSKGREVRKRDQEMAWKLGFALLRGDVIADDRYYSIKPINKAWLALSYAEFCQQLAQREGLQLKAGIDWSRYEAAGWRRQREVMLLSLPRQSVRRALELWLVLDMVNYLQQHGYDVTFGTFCQRQLTPRNILISARLQSF